MPLTQWSDEILIAELSDEPHFSEDLTAVMRHFEDGTTAPDLVLDMKNVTYLNSTNIAQLLRLRKKVTSADKRMKICAVPDGVWGVLMVTGLDKLFEFTDDVSTSLASLQLGL